MKVTVDFFDHETLYYNGITDIEDNNVFVRLFSHDEEIEYFLKDHISEIKKEDE